MSIRSVASPPKFRALINLGDGKHVTNASPSGDRQMPKRTGLRISKQYYDYIQKFQYFYIDRLPDMRPDMEALGFRDFEKNVILKKMICLNLL